MAEPSQRIYYSLQQIRRSTAHFLLGKGLSAALNFTILVFVASLLSKSDFAIYAWLFAGTQLLIEVSNVGVNWVALRYIPSMRVASSASQLIGFIKTLIVLRTVILAFCFCALMLFGELIISAIDLNISIKIFGVYSIVFLLDGLTSFVCLCVFGPLLYQGHAQANTVVRNVSVLSALLVAGYMTSGGLTVFDVVLADLVGVSLAFVLLILQLTVVLKKIRLSTVVRAGVFDTTPREMARFALNNFVSDLLQVAGSSNSMMMVGARLLEPSALAGFGFVRVLMERLRQYQPAQFFIGLLRPKLFASFAADKNFTVLDDRASLISKLSVFVLMPVIVSFVVFGQDILNVLSGNKYGQAYHIALILLFWIVIRSFLLVMTILVNALERPVILKRSAIGGVIALILAILLLTAGWGGLGLAVALTVGDVIFLLLVIIQIRSAGFDLRFNFSGHFRIFLVGCISGAIVSPLSAYTNDIVWLVFSIIITMLVYAGLARLIRPFRVSERDTINRFLGKSIFLW